MRNVLIFTNVLFLGAAIFFWSQLSGKKKELTNYQKLVGQNVVQHDTVYIKEGEEGSSNLTSCHDCSEKETYGHTFADFEDVVDRYKTKRWDVINQSFASNNVPDGMRPDEIAGMEDSRAIWFSLDSLKQFICTIEKYSNKLSPKASNLGIRMYYGVYSAAKQRFPHRHTLFMVPTFKDAKSSSDKTGIDFDPRQIFLSKKDVKFPISDLRTKPPVQLLVMTADNNDPQMKANDGDLCPPCSKGCIHGILDNN